MPQSYKVISVPRYLGSACHKVIKLSVFPGISGPSNNLLETLAALTWGDIDGQTTSNVDPLFRDHASTILFRQEIGYTDHSFVELTSLIEQYETAVEDALNNYKLLTQNSNSYAFQSVEVLGFVRPKSIPWAPGWSRILQTSP